MNEPSPLVPQGSFESQARRKSHVKIAVFSILAVHVVVLGGLLILGCKREDKGTTDTAGTPTPMADDATTPPPFGQDAVTTTEPAVPPSQVSGVPTSTTTSTPPPTPPPASTTLSPPPPATDTGAMIEHKIATGESFSTLAAKYGVTIKAIQDANPNLVPTKLQIGNVVKIPPKTTVAPRTNGAPAADSTDTYVVKSGDNLIKIAEKHQTSVRELQRINNLRTTQIKVGDKLKLPPRTAGGAVPAAQ